MRKLKLMADYHCHPLWDLSSGAYGDVDPNELPISEALKQQLVDWALEFDSTFNEADPAASGFQNNEVEAAFKHEGVQLAAQLQRELGPEFVVFAKT